MFDLQETTRYCYKLNQQAVGLMAPDTSENIFKVFPIISLWELYVTHGSLSPSYNMCFTLNFIRTDIYTPLKIEADKDNRPSIYPLSYLT